MTDKVTTTLLHLKETNPGYYNRLLTEYGEEGLKEEIRVWDEFVVNYEGDNNEREI